MKEDNKEVENKNIENAQEKNSIQISDDVIAVIAGMAVAEVPGVADMAGGFAGGISEVLSGKKNMAKGIKVDVLGEEVKIDVNIIVDYGTRIPDVAFEIQKRVKKSIENMTGLKATEVNVHVQGVLTEQDKKEAKVEDKKENKEETKKAETKKTTEKKAEKK
ncbi:MAG: Asp23/Gls24 family envelope stress response protein [Clostridia bacterium]|nr:Asp23/Gls24 family envelope stress response protein [Clostridia bacterium]